MQKFELAPTLGLHTFADLERQQGFRQDVKLTDHLIQNAVVVEPYYIGTDLIPCGLTCNQGHNKGFLVLLPDAQSGRCRHARSQRPHREWSNSR